jgi:steroid delta-isomerase-like uncharacterized protein
MAITSIPIDRKSARLALVQEHVRLENEHQLEDVLKTFGESAQYQDEAWGDSYLGRDGVRSYYEGLMAALPDLEIKVQQQHVTDDYVVLEVLIRGTHLGPWRGLPATGRRVEVPLCAIYSFDDGNRLAGERIYYDRASVLRQLGIFHEPQTLLGRIEVLVAHPVTIGHALFRAIFTK